jgi:hypothetical protein
MKWFDNYQKEWRAWLSVFCNTQQVDVLMQNKVAREFLFDTVQYL